MVMKQPSELPGGQVAVTIHTGLYDAMRPACQALVSWASEHGGELAGNPWEVYFSHPSAGPPPDRDEPITIRMKSARDAQRRILGHEGTVPARR